MDIREYLEYQGRVKGSLEILCGFGDEGVLVDGLSLDVVKERDGFRVRQVPNCPYFSKNGEEGKCYNSYGDGFECPYFNGFVRFFRTEESVM
jgi:hypothetical protein